MNQKPALPQKPPAEFGLRADRGLYKPACRFFLQELAHARAHEKGMILDQDNEYTHQYRVALRRCRALTVLLKDLFEPQARETAKSTMRLLMQNTNLLRDIDVFLEQADDYHNSLQENSHGLSLFFAHLLQTRAETHHQLCHWLSSAEYEQHCQMLHHFFSSISTNSHRRLPAREYGQKQIWKYFSRIIKQGRELEAHSPDSQLHRLRIQCKKLRYLLEFFRPLFEEDGIEQQIKALKRLQNLLGAFNDTATQLQFFSDYLQHHPAQAASRHAIFLLAEMTRKEHESTKTGVLFQVESFINKENQSSFKMMYFPET